MKLLCKCFSAHFSQTGFNGHCVEAQNLLFKVQGSVSSSESSQLLSLTHSPPGVQRNLKLLKFEIPC